MPQRTCTGCRTVAPQRELVRIAVADSRLVVDPASRRGRLAGRGAYVHARPACVTIPGLARSLKRTVSRAELGQIVAAVAEMSRADDNCAPTTDAASGPGAPTDNPGEPGDETDHLRGNAIDLSPGLAGADTVETPPRIKAKDDRSEDARV
ncbi:MAG: YlxR family protein [Deltaproteobacteria bacterium]|nr:YlxR family protein [Deltaproteobacteria bacterium]